MTIGVALDPGWVWDDEFPLSQAVKAGNWLYLSGQIPVDSDGRVAGEGDMKAQSQRVFENMETVLKMAGATFQNIVKTTTYLTDMSRYREFNEVRKTFLKDHRPASTMVQVCKLARPGLLVEVEAVAYLGG